jgi:hypothetical protein
MLRLGCRVKCKVTGFTGIVTARCDYINGCIQYCVLPPVDKDGKRMDGVYIDEGQLEYVDDGILETVEAPLRKVGGPQSNAPSVDYRG